MASTMTLASSHQAFLRGTSALPATIAPRRLSCRCSSERNSSSSNSKSSGGGDGEVDIRIAKLVAVTLATTALVLNPVDDAMAAKSGGRVGGNAFRSAMPKGSPRINSRTNVYVNPPIAPPLLGGYGYGYGGYGYGMPFFGGALGIGGLFEFFIAFLVLNAVANVIRRFTNRSDEDDD